MKSFDDAVRAAVVAMREMCEYYSPTSDYIPPSARILETITKHFEPLADLNAKLVELFKLEYDQDGDVRALSNANFERRNELRAIVAAAIKADISEVE